MMQPVPADLSVTLVERVDRVAHISGSARDMRHRIGFDRIDAVLATARAALASGDAAALEAALRRVDLLSLELCEE